MSYEYALRESDNIIIGNITQTGIVPSGCIKYLSDDNLKNHESGAPSWKLVDGEIVQRTANEVKLEPEYIAWKKIKREELIVKLIRNNVSQNKEYQILRRAIAKIANSEAVEQEFTDYNTFVESILTSNPEE